MQTIPAIQQVLRRVVARIANERFWVETVLYSGSPHETALRTSV